MPFHPPFPEHVVRGDIFYWDGVDLRRLALGTASQVLSLSSGVPDWVSLDDTYLANRTRRIDFDLGAGVLISGTGAFTSSNGLRISYPDAEDGERAWATIAPADLVTGGGTIYWLWETPATGALVARFRVLVGGGVDGSAAAFNAHLDNTADHSIDGTANILQLSSVALTSNLTAGQRSISVSLLRLGSNVNDTVGDVVYLRAIWIEYTADM